MDLFLYVLEPVLIVVALGGLGLAIGLLALNLGPHLFNAYHRWTVRRWEKKQL